MDIVVTAQNMEPYFGEIYVSSPDGAYVTINNVILDSGDDDLISIGETITITVSLENVGSENAENIDISLLNIDNDPYINLINSNEILDNLADGQTSDINLSFSINNNSPFGHATSLMLEIISDDNTYSNLIEFNVEYLIESFESTSFNEFLWEFSGDEGWTIAGAQFIGDSYSAQSGEIDHNMTSEIFINIDVAEDGVMKFDKKVSCEDVGSQTGNYYDYLAFYIDNIEQGKWAGEIEWSQNTFNVSQGEHTFLWKYVKDPGVSVGDDAVWIDNIIFPPSYYESYVLGDVNDDGVINIADVIIAVNIILGTLEFNQAADMNGDGSIDVVDIINIVSIILG